MTQAALPHPKSKRRLRGIDAARGAAMVLVCLAHFSFEYFKSFEASLANQVIGVVSRTASPTFMLLSGMMLGLLYHTRPAKFPAVARTLAGRGLFMITVGHLLILISCIPRSGLDGALRRGFITDAIGLSVLVGPFVITRLGARGRVLLGTGLFALGTAIAYLWHPASPALDALRYLLGGPPMGDGRFNFPLLAWVGVYFFGSVMGGWMGRHYLAADARGVERGLLQGGVVAIAAAAVIKGTYLALRASGVFAAAPDVAYQLFSPFSKLPPSIPYVLTYGGAGMLMTGALLFLNRRERLTPLIDWLTDLGRASLFVFLFQFYVYYVGFFYLRLEYSLLWPIYFGLSLFLITVAARYWLAAKLNRVFDMGRWFGKPSGEPRREVRRL